MSYSVRFPTPSLEKKFGKQLSSIPQKNIREKIIKEVENLSQNPYPKNKRILKKLRGKIPFVDKTAQYRIKIGDYRVLYDVDDDRKIVWIFSLRIRSEKTYK